MSARRVRVVLSVAVLVSAAIAIAAAFGAFSAVARHSKASNFVSGGRYGQGAGRASDAAGEGPVGTYDAFLSALRTYPANLIPPAVVAHEKQTFNQIDQQGEQGGDSSGGNQWHPYGPLQSAIQPGVLAFSGATNATASRVTAMLIAPACHPGDCRVWVGVAGGGVWRTEDATTANPTWTWLTDGIAQNSVGALSADPNDPSGNTLYLGTGEANRCSSGCEAGVGVYKTTDGGDSWTKLADSCVSNSTYSCTIAGLDAFLGRGIAKIVIDPTNPNHLFVGSALGVRGLSHTIGNGATTRFEPGANPVGVYESTDGGRTFTEVWNGNGTLFGITDLGLDPGDPQTVYASAFENGLWRRAPALDGAASPTDFKQVFAAQFAGGGADRTMFAATTLANGKTRLYLTDGTANPGGRTSPTAANFWRTDNANQPAAALLASQGAGKTPPPDPGIPFPSSFNGWQVLTSSATASPYFATVDFCTAQCWYDEAVYTPKGMPDTVYVIGSYQYGEIPCNTKGVGCGNGRSNGRAVLYSTTAGDPDPAHSKRTFTDLTNDAQDTPASWCAFQGSPCLRAPNSIHPDQHVVVVNPSNPTQIFEGSDGGVIRTSGTFQDISAQCNDPGRPPATTGSYLSCQRLLSRVPTQLAHTDLQLDTLQFINVAINPGHPCEVMGGTQDNGTWSNPGCGVDTWPQIIYGDGGNAGYDGTNPTWRFNEFTSGLSDSNFQNGDPTKWVITSAPIVNSGENVSFYWPQIADPNPPTGAHPIFSGAQHVWRTWAFGAGTPAKVPQDTTPNISGYEANCPEFTVAGNDPRCGDYQPLGGPVGANAAGDLTGTAYGADRTGGAISWLARVKTDHGTLWATTSAGRVFVSHNADAVDPAVVAWHRLDNATSPTRYPSSIYPDPADTTHAWVTYSGYNAATPTTPGHVFDLREGGVAPGSGVFTNLKVENGTAAFPTPTGDGDLPVSDIVRDDARHKLYVSTDFGVLRGNKDGQGGWRVMSGMPRLEVMHLEIEPSARVPSCTGATSNDCPKIIYAATHSQGIWALNLNPGGDNGGGGGGDNGGGGGGGGNGGGGGGNGGGGGGNGGGGGGNGGGGGGNGGGGGGNGGGGNG